jgi:hypothetical protein
MAQQTINLGAVANDGSGDTLRDGGDKINDNFTELYTALTGLLDFKGSTDCSANPNYPAASKGDYYLVSVAGKIGGASGIDVTAGDSYFATADNAGGTQASVGASWTVIQGNLVVSNDTTLSGDSSSKVPTEHAVKAYVDALGGTIPSGYSDENARDAIGAALVAGSGISIAVNDGADTITIANTAAYTDEQAQDAVAAMIAAGTHTGLTVTYNDAGNAMSFTLSNGGLATANEWAPNFTAAGDVYIPAVVAMTIDQGNTQIGTGTLAFAKSTSAAPGTFTTTTLPATLQAGAWLKVSASAVSGFVATHLKRTA